jgi:type III restriction enzyme
MDNRFFEKPILNSPYEYPKSHWELDKEGQPTQQIINRRRSAEFITPIPKPRKRKKADAKQAQFDFGTDEGLSSSGQRYDPAPVINRLRRQVDIWRGIPNPSDWRVTPETARLLQHWRHHKFNDIRPFFCQLDSPEF